MRQYGELNEKVANKDGTFNAKGRDAEFTKNPAKYPALNSHPEQAKIPDEKQGSDVRMPFTRQPLVNTRTQSQRVQTPRSQPSAPSRNNYNNIQRAQSYHSNGWQQAEPRSSAPSYSAPARSSGGGGGGGGGGSHGGGGGHR